MPEDEENKYAVHFRYINDALLMDDFNNAGEYLKEKKVFDDFTKEFSTLMLEFLMNHLSNPELMWNRLRKYIIDNIQKLLSDLKDFDRKKAEELYNTLITLNK